MKILLDECVPWPMYKMLTGHEGVSVQKHGWTGIKNGELLALAERVFDLFITSDQSIEYQENLAGRSIGILTLSTNNLRRIVAAAALVQTAVATVQPVEYRRLDIP